VATVGIVRNKEAAGSNWVLLNSIPAATLATSSLISLSLKPRVVAKGYGSLSYRAGATCPKEPLNAELSAFGSEAKSNERLLRNVTRAA
jgi:hypothetical protein